MFLHFYINPSGMGKGGRGVGERVRVPVRGCCSDIFLTICISHTPWPGKRNENGGNDLLISEVCAHTYIHTYVRICLCGSVIDRSKFELVWTVQGRGVRSGDRGRGRGMKYGLAMEMEMNARDECVWVHHQHHIPHSPLTKNSFAAPYTTLVRVCMCVYVCVCVKIYGVLENCVRRTLKVCQKICRKTRQKQIYMRRRSLCINVLFDKSFEELLADQRAASTT